MNKLLLALLLCIPNIALAQQPSKERQTELIYLLRQDCGSCHGMTLKGGLGPALTEQALADKNAEYLFHTIRLGRANTPMPPWQGLLSDSDIKWLVDILKQGLDK
jgi:cytochrome c55X